jgi:hypothetical protein
VTRLPLSPWARFGFSRIGLAAALALAGAVGCDSDPAETDSGVEPDTGPPVVVDAGVDAGPPIPEGNPFVQNTSPEDGAIDEPVEASPGTPRRMLLLWSLGMDDQEGTVSVDPPMWTLRSADASTLWADEIDIFDVNGNGVPDRQDLAPEFAVNPDGTPAIDDLGNPIEVPLAQRGLDFLDGAGNGSPDMPMPNGVNDVLDIYRSQFGREPYENIAASFLFPEVLTGGIEYIVTVNCDFLSGGGTPNSCPENDGEDQTIFSFETLDLQLPTVLSSIPEEGASNISAERTDQICLEFDEAMNTVVGTLRLLGGPGRVGDAEWEVNTVCFAVRNLAYDTTYQVILEDFVDRNGNSLDGMPYLLNGVLDFSTGPDIDEPFVDISVPVEGQRGVNPATRNIRLEFSEEMEDNDIVAPLSDGTTITELVGEWTDDNTVLTFDVTGLLAFETSYTLDLNDAELFDLAGNVFDGVTNLNDGILDFRVDMDTFGPRAVSSTPEEAERGVDVTTPLISVQFDEPLNETVTTALLADGTVAREITCTYSGAGTTFDCDIRDLLRAGREYTLDLRGIEDLSGNGIDITDPYLGDGILDFRTADPSGDDCTQPLTALQAARTPTGGLQYTIPSGTLTDNGSTDVCDNGPGGGGADVVIEYEKTTGNLGSGPAGRALSVRIESDTTAAVNFEIRNAICDPTGEDTTPIQRCQEGFVTGGTTIDVSEGTYYIWIARGAGGTFPGATVTIEEVVELPEGESCARPYTTASAGVYVPPRTPGAAHTFQIRPNQISDFDRDRFSNGPGEISCVGGSSGTEHAADAVIEFTKMPGSVLQVRAIPVDIRFTAADINLEISLGCDPARDSNYQSLACEAGFEFATSFTVTGPAGPVYFWVSGDDRDREFPGATVEIDEITVGPGESCDTAIPAVTTMQPDGRLTAPVTLNSTTSLGGQGCLDPMDQYTWYSYTSTDDIAIVSTNAETPIVLADQAAGRTISCSSDGSSASPALIRAGRTLCVGIPNMSGVTELEFSERSYDGVTGATVTDTGILRPLDSSGTEVTWLDDHWIATTPTVLYYGINGSTFTGPGPQVIFAPISGGVRGVLAPGIGAVEIGDAAVTVGENLYTVDDTSSSFGNRRVFFATDGLTFPWLPEALDTVGVPYNDSTLAMAADGTDLIMVSDNFTTAEFYSVPQAGGTVVELGANSGFQFLVGLAADANYFYVLGEDASAGTLEGQLLTGLFRIARTNLSGTPELIGELPFDSLFPGNSSFANTQGLPVVMDNTGDTPILYFRAVSTALPNAVYAILDPGGTEPLFLGSILRIGTNLDFAMTFDPTRRSIFLFETETDSNGRIVEIQ